MYDSCTVEALRQAGGANPWMTRICAELSYLERVFEAKDMPVPEAYRDVLRELTEKVREEGAISRTDALRAEAALAAYGPLAKANRVICAGHAHIDMNWEWGIDETVGTVIDTFQTMLNLMEEYPDFTFSQSQASTYEIVEKYCPSMLPEIRRRVAEGRWEVTASTWVEHDKNMAGTESMARQVLYTRRYLSGLLGIDPASLNIDFEPDTFGHSAFVPEVLSRAGVKYYYHCRGDACRRAYRFRAPSGSELLAYNEVNWYLGPIKPDMFGFVPGFCRDNSTDTALVVYGVGDHGGGPTRRDLERIREIASWPLMPAVRFGRIGEFFAALEAARDRLPVIDRELNFVFTGCYTAQSRIKAANRHCEDQLYDSEALCAMARQADASPIAWPNFEKAWRRVLFNQFHDILPGSGVRETREYALGTAAEARSFALANANRALRAIAAHVDTSAFGVSVDPESTAEGAGPGFGATISSRRERLWSGSGFDVTRVGRSGGDVRPYTLVNPTQFRRDEVVELTVWDWPYDLRETAVVDAEGRRYPFDITAEVGMYWQHTFFRLAFHADVPAFGFANYYVVRRPADAALPVGDEPRVHGMEDGVIVMANDRVRAEFASHTMKLLRLTDLASGRELVSPDRPGACLYLAEESEVLPYNAWTIGNYGRIEDLSETCFVDIREKRLGGPCRQWIAYGLKFRNSEVKVRVSLDEGSSMLRYSFDVEWNDVAVPGVSTPQLRFRVPFAYGAEKVRCSVPAGHVDRPRAGHDIPAILYAAAIPDEGGPALMMTSDSKYGYRFSQDSLDLNLVRASCVPDKYPEVGFHRFEVGVGVAASADWLALSEQGMRFAHPVYAASNSCHPGRLGQRGSLIEVEGRALVASVKACEATTDDTLFRLVNGDDAPASVEIRRAGLRRAALADVNETILGDVSVSDDRARVETAPRTLTSVIVN